MKKIISLLLSFCLLAGAFQVSASALGATSLSSSTDAGGNIARRALLTLEDWLFALNERICETLRGLNPESEGRGENTLAAGPA